MKILASFALLTICSCSAPPPPAAPSYEHAVAALDRPVVSQRVIGRIENRKPVGHTTPRPFLPIASFAREGDTVKAGDTVMTLDANALVDDQQVTALSLGEQQAEKSRDQLQAEATLAELEDRRAELQARLQVAQAQLVAVGQRDKEDLAVAQLERRIAERNVERARVQCERVRALAQEGAATPLAGREAERALMLAEAKLRLPLARIDYLGNNRSVLARERLQQTLGEIRASLGDTASGRGVEGAIAMARGRLSAITAASQASYDTLKHEFDQRQALIDHPQLTATGAGVVALRGDDIRPGGKYPMSSLVFVMGQEELVVTLDLPERIRDLVQGGGGRVRITVDGAGSEALAGRILSVAPAPRQLPGQSRRTYPCTIRLDQPDARLRVGMQAACDLELAVPGAMAVIPSWCIASRSTPQVMLADGSERSLTGMSIGEDFVVFSGVRPGERLRLPGRPPATGQTRLSGVLDATEARRIRLRGTEWELVDRVADGTPVKAGELIARLSPQVKNASQISDSFSIEQRVMKATTSLVVARINAEETLAKAMDVWQRALLAVDKSQLELMSARFVATDDRHSAAALRLAQADATIAKADEEAAEIDTPAVVAVSGQEVRRRRLEQALARLDRDRARINEILVLRERDWLRVLRRIEDVRAAEEAVQRARTDVLLARADYHASLARAQERYRAELFDIEGERLNRIDEEVRSPVDGAVFQNPAIGRDGLVVGRRIPHLEPFIIPVGNRRTVVFEVPARFYGRFQVGQELPVVVPALGLEPRRGVISTVAAYFLDSSAWRDEIRFAGAVGVSEKIFQLSVTFTFTDSELARVPPGATAHVDL